MNNIRKYEVEIADLSGEERKRHGDCIRAVKAGIKRKPLKGEWYLSGAVVTGYKALNDLGQEFEIAYLIGC